MIKVKQKQLDAIWTTLQRPLISAKDGGYRFDLEATINKGWIRLSDLEDAVYSWDKRLDCTKIKLEELAISFGINWTIICKPPKDISNDVELDMALRLPELVSFSIFLKSIGFEINSQILLDRLLPEIKGKEIITNAELHILRNEKSLRMSRVSIHVSDQEWDFEYCKKGSFENGYKYEASFRPNGTICNLTIKSPTYRKMKEPTSTKCQICGHTWLKGNPKDSAAHRKFHKCILSILEPIPNKNMLSAFRNENDPELVDNNSPLWRHKEMRNRAIGFKMETGFGFVQWSHAKDARKEENVFGFLLTLEDGTIIGSVAFRYQDGSEISDDGYWYLDWVWVAPRHRRNGALTKRWRYYKDRFGEFYVSHPISEEMKKFLHKMNDEHLSLKPYER